MAKAIATVLLIGLICGCRSRTVLVHYVLPNGYRGPLRIVEGRDDSNGYAFDGLRHVYHFPSSGTLHVKTIWPITEWHRLTAEYEDGSPIYWVEPGPPGPDAIRIRGLGASSDNRGFAVFWDVVGNEDEVNRWEREWQSGDLQRSVQHGTAAETSRRLVVLPVSPCYDNWWF